MNKIRNILNSNYFIAFIYLITIICWFYHWQNLAIIIYLISAIVIIIFNANRINLATLIMAGIISFREKSFSGNAKLFIIIFLIVLPFIVYDFFKNHLKVNDWIFISMFLIVVASILSLINSNRENINYVIMGILQTGAFALIYLYFINKHQKDDFLYIAKNATALGLAIAIEFILYIITYQGDTLGKDIDLGWGISNGIAMLEMMMIPLIIYLYSSNQSNTYLLLSVIVVFVVIVSTLSKGAYLTLLIIIFPLFLVTYMKIPDRKKFINDIIYSLFVFTFLLYLTSNIEFIKNGFLTYFKKMNDRGWFNDQSRVEIYKIGLETFKIFPIFGGGAYTGGYYLGKHGLSITTYHNYLIQILATIGITGFIAFIMYLYNIIRRIIKVNHLYNFCILFDIIALMLHGLVDNTWFNPMVMVIVSIFFSTILTEKDIKNLNNTLN